MINENITAVEAVKIESPLFVKDYEKNEIVECIEYYLKEYNIIISIDEFNDIIETVQDEFSFLEYEEISDLLFDEMEETGKIKHLPFYYLDYAQIIKDRVFEDSIFAIQVVEDDCLMKGYTSITPEDIEKRHYKFMERSVYMDMEARIRELLGVQ